MAQRAYVDTGLRTIAELLLLNPSWVSEKMAGGFTGTNSQDLATLLDPFRDIFVDLGPDHLACICGHWAPDHCRDASAQSKLGEEEKWMILSKQSPLEQADPFV